jgi:hypothetical protein
MPACDARPGSPGPEVHRRSLPAPCRSPEVRRTVFHTLDRRAIAARSPNSSQSPLRAYRIAQAKPRRSTPRWARCRPRRVRALRCKGVRAGCLSWDTETTLWRRAFRGLRTIAPCDRTLRNRARRGGRKGRDPDDPDTYRVGLATWNRLIGGCSAAEDRLRPRPPYALPTLSLGPGPYRFLFL